MIHTGENSLLKAPSVHVGFCTICIPSKLFWPNQASYQGIHFGQAKVPADLQ